MRKTTVKNLIHFIIISIPMILLLIACIFPTKQINNKYTTNSTEETTTIINFNQLAYPKNSTEYGITINYNQNGSYHITGTATSTNGPYFTIAPNQNNKALGFKYYSGHKIILRTNGDTNFLRVQIYNGGNNSYNTTSFNSIYSSTFDNTDFLYINCWFRALANQTYDIDNIYLEYFDLTQMGLDSLTYEEFNHLFPLHYTYTENQEITLNTLVNNVGNNAELPLQVEETKQPNENILQPFKEFYALSINDWYRDVLEVLNINLDNNNLVKSYIIYYPVWLMWFYLFELIEIIITAIPRLIMQLIAKIGGGSDV